MEPPRDDGYDLTDFLVGDNVSARERLFERARSATPPNPAAELAALLDDVEAFVRAFVVVTPAQAAAITLWVAHTHAVEAADTTPYLTGTSATMRSGKSRLIEVVRGLVRKPLVAAGVSEAALFRSLAGGVTLLFDEVDAVFGPKAREHEDVRAMLNAGYQRGTPVLRCVGEGSKQKVVPFDVYGPKLLCGIGALPTTIADRSLTIRLKRRRRDEPVKRWRKRDGVHEQAGRLHARLAEWAEAALEPLTAAAPLLPDELDDRAQDAYEPLLAIAEAAGERWAARARKALVELRTEQDHDDEGAAVRLLADIKAAFVAAGRDRLSTAELLDRLAADDEAPWRGWHGGDRRLSPRALGRLLGGFEIRSRTIRLDDGTTPKGYHADQFEDAWKRYPPGSADSIRHTATTRSQSQEAPISHPPQTHVVADREEGANPHEHTDVADVADRSPQPGRFSAECIVCERPFDPADPDAGPVTCPACVARRRRPQPCESRLGGSEKEEER